MPQSLAYAITLLCNRPPMSLFEITVDVQSAPPKSQCRQLKVHPNVADDGILGHVLVAGNRDLPINNTGRLARGRNPAPQKENANNN